MRRELFRASGWARMAAGLAGMTWASGPGAGAADPSPRSGIEKTGFDAKARPQDDLFRHVNGGWLAEAEIPPEYGWFGSFLELRDKSLRDIRAISEEAAGRDDHSSGSEARKIGDLYAGF